MKEILLKIMDSQTLSHISSIIGISGGMLGFWSFIDNYLLKFNPKFKISDSIFLRYSVEKTGNRDSTRLKSIFLKINILNTRNKIGRIDNLALRIYDSASTKPEPYLFFAKRILDQNFCKKSMMNTSGSIFSAISILNKTDYSVILELNPEKYRLPDLIAYLTADLMYLSSDKKWCYVCTYNLHTDIPNEIQDQDILESSVYSHVLSQDINDTILAPKSSLYKGISEVYLSYAIFFLKNVFHIPKRFIKLCCDICNIVTSHIFCNLVILPIINLKYKKLPLINIKTGKPHLVNNTEETLKTMFSILNKIIANINLNLTADNESKININKESDNQFTISRGSLYSKYHRDRNSITFTFYKIGDGYIGINDDRQQMNFSMELVEYIFGVKLWKINGKMMSVKTCCIKIMDFICL